MLRSYGKLIAVFLVSAQAAFAGSVNPKVVVTTPPLKPYTDTLLTGIGESRSLLRAGQDSHTFTLSPSQRRMLAEADIIILPDRAMNPVLEKLLATEERRGAKVISLIDLPGAKPLPLPSDNPWLRIAGQADDEHDDAHEHMKDAHLWLDPERMAALTDPLARAIASKAPSHGPKLMANAQRSAIHLRRDVAPGIAAILAKAPRTRSMSSRPQVPFITYHAAYQYFFTRFGIEPMGQVTQLPEDYLGARSMKAVAASAEKLAIGCIISETNSPLVQRVASASGARIVRLSPEMLYTPTEVPNTPWVTNDYDRFLAKTAYSFAECL